MAQGSSGRACYSKHFWLARRLLNCLKSAIRGRLFATEHLKGWCPFDPVIDSGRSNLFLYTICPFFLFSTAFPRSSTSWCLLHSDKVFNKTWIDADTSSQLQNIGSYCIFHSRSSFLARKLSRFLVVLLHSILRPVIPCPGRCFLPCLCAVAGPVKQPMNPLGCVSSSRAARSWSWLPGLIQVAPQQGFGCKARSSQPFLVGGNTGGVAQWLKAGSCFPGPERFYGKEEEVWAAQAERDMLR